ncbi:hypothetical protein, conserved [Leishmania tarentolae]|uniref:Pyrroline-5-carboxylate reductase catalytic N-terminal domain-containing protein n=1 Tax=Leishmania tarentolae TaxID=5689 RepID=A0A640KBV0_LEITA|nr:hypothetical protein, conserved [Leishmania tarentolae]
MPQKRGSASLLLSRCRFCPPAPISLPAAVHLVRNLSMHTDYSLLLSTVLSESGCADPSLQHTAETVPLVYRTLAEHSYYLMYVVSVTKALLNEGDTAFGHLAREQAERQKAATECVLTPEQHVTSASPSPLPPLALSDSLDMHLTIIGGGTCCELMLRLICGLSCAGGSGGGGIVSRGGARDPLVHPSHITVITRQPERLARFADLGVHCLTRHHGRQAVERSDVVVLACPPSQLQEVMRDLFASAAMETTRSGGSLPKKTVTTASSPSPPSVVATTSFLRPNAILLFCMAGVSVRKVAQTFHCSSLDLIFTPSLQTFSMHPPCAATACEGDTEPSITASSFACSQSTELPCPTNKSHTPEQCVTPLEVRSIEEAAECFTDATAAYRSTRLAEMHCSTSFLRPAVLQKTAKRASAGATTVRRATWSRLPQQPDDTLCPASAAPPCLADFTAGRHPSTCPTLAEYLDLWRVLKAYVQATFEEEARRLARARGVADGNRPRHHDNDAKDDSHGGFVSAVLPHTKSGRRRIAHAGKVESELLPALVLLPAAQTRILWDAWWGNSRCDALPDRGNGEPSLPLFVTHVTGMWLCRVYTSAASLKMNFDDQFRHLLSACTR